MQKCAKEWCTALFGSKLSSARARNGPLKQDHVTNWASVVGPELFLHVHLTNPRYPTISTLQ